MNKSNDNNLSVYVTPKADVIFLNIDGLICLSQEPIDDGGDI